MAKEYERKFIFKGGRKAAEDFLKQMKRVRKQPIDQCYFVEQAADILFDWIKNVWFIQLTKSDFCLEIKALDKELDQLYNIIHHVDGNLINIHGSSFRLRKKKGKFLFTAKFIDDDEFEYELDMTDDTYILWESMLAPVSKLRHVFNFNEHTRELDLFNKIKTPDHLLEIEFETLEEKNAFVPEDFLIEVTGQKQYSNKFIAISNSKFA